MREKLIGSVLLMTVLSPNLFAISQRRTSTPKRKSPDKVTQEDNVVKLKGEIGEKLKQIIADELGVEESELTAKKRLVDDLGADSLDCVELIMRFEEEFNIEIPDEDAVKIKTVGDAYKYIEQSRNKKKKAR